MSNMISTHSIKNQQGVILVVALIMLLVMTIVGITTMNNATLQERMAGNNRQLSVARLSAQAALKRAELYLRDEDYQTGEEIFTDFAAGTAGHLVMANAINDYQLASTNEVSWNYKNSSLWDSDNSLAADDGNADATDSRYFIEYIGRYDDSRGFKQSISLDSQEINNEEGWPYVFRITAIGYGNNDNIYTVLQSIYMTQQGREAP